MEAEQTFSNVGVPADRVARRSLVLAAVVCRASLESGVGQSEAEALQRRVIEWLTRARLWDAVEPMEKELLDAPPGKLKAFATKRAAWYVEGLAVLAWALCQLEFPTHDHLADPYAVADAVWFLDDSAEQFILTARLRNFTELQAGRELLFAIHSRLRDFRRHGGQKDFAAWIEQTWIDSLNIDKSRLLVDRDLAIGGVPVNKTDLNRLQECEHIIREQHRAMIWLVGESSIYSQTSVDT